MALYVASLSWLPATIFSLLAWALPVPAVAFSTSDLLHLRDSGFQSCPECDLSLAELQGANLSGARLQGANLSGAQLQGANLSGAQLQRANLSNAQLQRANLRRANLRDANLGYAVLNNAALREAHLQGAFMQGAWLENADLRQAQLQKSRLYGAHLANALLMFANLRRAQLAYADLEGASLAFADFSRATYAPVVGPPSGSVAGIRGLSTVRIPRVSSTRQFLISGLVELRELLQRSGHRTLEREATFSIERARTRAALAVWRAEPLRAFEGAFRIVAFEATTGYGLYPARALLILLGLIVLLSFFYLPSISHHGRSRYGAIYRIWPSERLLEDVQGVRLVIYEDVLERQRAQRLKANTVLGRWGYALWFSTLSAFHIGWRELSIGTWLSRLQPREYALRAEGWPRVISGAQSLISVYLIAIWALTYFGRPFE